MKVADINKTGSWRARQILGTVAESMELNGSCMLIAAEKKDWAEYRRLWLESNKEMKKLGKIFYENTNR